MTKSKWISSVKFKAEDGRRHTHRSNLCPLPFYVSCNLACDVTSNRVVIKVVRKLVFFSRSSIFISISDTFFFFSSFRGRILIFGVNAHTRIIRHQVKEIHFNWNNWNRFDEFLIISADLNVRILSRIKRSDCLNEFIRRIRFGPIFYRTHRSVLL